MSIKKSLGENIFDGFNIALMIVLILVTVYPFVFIAFASISDPAWVISYRGLMLWPHGFYTGAYQRVFENPMIASGYKNTLFYLIIGTSVNILLTSLGAYGLSRKDIMLRTPITMLIVFTMFF